MADSIRVLGTIGWAGIVVMSLFGFSKKSISELKQNKGVILIAGVFVMTVFYGLFTDLENIDYLKSRVMIKVPFLLIPLALFFLPRLSLKRFQFILWVFAMTVFVIAIKAMVYFLGHIDEVIKLYSISKTMPLPLNHVRFSLMLSYACLLYTSPSPRDA